MQQKVKQYFLSYHGSSKLSRTIRFYAWEFMNHTAPVLHGDYSIVDAWSGGVRHIQDPWEGHNKRTRMYLGYVEVEPGVPERLREFWLSQVGKPYAYMEILGFIVRREPFRYRGANCRETHPDDIKSWMCSGLAQYAMCREGYPFMQKPWYKTRPGEVWKSSRMVQQGEFTGINWDFFRKRWIEEDQNNERD